MELIRCDKCKKEMPKTEDKAVMLFRTGKDMRRGDFGVDELPIDLCMECKDEVKNFALGITEKDVEETYSDDEVIEIIGKQEESDNE